MTGFVICGAPPSMPEPKVYDPEADAFTALPFPAFVLDNSCSHDIVSCGEKSIIIYGYYWPTGIPLPYWVRLTPEEVIEWGDGVDTRMGAWMKQYAMWVFIDGKSVKLFDESTYKDVFSCDELVQALAYAPERDLAIAIDRGGSVWGIYYKRDAAETISYKKLMRTTYVGHINACWIPSIQRFLCTSSDGTAAEALLLNAYYDPEAGEIVKESVLYIPLPSGSRHVGTPVYRLKHDQVIIPIVTDRPRLFIFDPAEKRFSEAPHPFGGGNIYSVSASLDGEWVAAGGDGKLAVSSYPLLDRWTDLSDRLGWTDKRITALNWSLL